jgi:hypothetical protein
VLDYALMRCPASCERLVAADGLKSIFPVFMGHVRAASAQLPLLLPLLLLLLLRTRLPLPMLLPMLLLLLLPRLPRRRRRTPPPAVAAAQTRLPQGVEAVRKAMGEEEAALEVAHVVAIVLSLLEQLERGGVPALRVLRKFEENNHEKVDRLVDLRTMYSRRVRPAAGVRTCVRVCVCTCACMRACLYLCVRVCSRVCVSTLGDPTCMCARARGNTRVHARCRLRRCAVRRPRTRPRRTRTSWATMRSRGTCSCSRAGSRCCSGST